jgi:glycosyltransferase involved in cell wall biosynthesis
MNGRLLLISYMFPPAGGVGVHRPLSQARYLPRSGLSVTVLTVKDPIAHVYDAALEKTIPPEVRVYHAAAIEPPYALRQRVRHFLGRPQTGPETPSAPATPNASFPPRRGLRRWTHALLERIFFPDLQILWVRPALREAIRLIETGDIGSVLISAPPYSLLCFAAPLRRRFPGLRIILDLRDEWLQYHFQELQFDGPVSNWKLSHAARLEAAAVAAADSVVTVTPPWQAVMRDRYPRQPASKFLCIPNGYDPDALRGFRRRPPAVPPLIVSYLGTLHANPVYSPQPYFDALDALPESCRDRIETRFIGRVAADAAPLLAARRSRIVQTGFLPQQEAFRQLETSHCLLLLIGTATAHSGKLFEYLAMGIPILAVTPRGGEVERVLAETRGGLCAPPDDPAAIGRALQQIYHSSFGQPGAGLFAPDPDSVAAYSRERLAAELARATGLLDE